MKNSIIDIKTSKNNISPESNYVRLKTGLDNSLQVIYSDGRKRTITHTWEIPAETVNTTDPATLTLVNWGRYIIPTGAVGSWTGHEQEIGTWNPVDNVWEFTTPEQGWGVYVKAENQIYTFNGSQWSNITASQTIINVTYDELRLLIRNQSLIPGNLYKISDIQTNNEILKNSGITHQSNDITLLAQAISNNMLEASVTDLDHPDDLVIYTPSMTKEGWFYVDVYRSDNSIYDSDYGFSNGYVWDFNNTPYFTINFLSDTELYLGEDTVLESDQYVTVGDDGSYAYLQIGVDATWDQTTNILTLLNGYTFKLSTDRYFVQLGGMFASPEFRKGCILQRHDLRNNIDVDFDFRNYSFGLYNARIDFYNSDNLWYCSPTKYSITMSSPRIDYPSSNPHREILHDVRTNDYIVKTMLSGSCDLKNIKIKNSRFIIFENVNMNNFEIYNADGVYFLNTYARNTKIDYVVGSIFLPGSQLVDSHIKEMTSIIQKNGITGCEIGRIDRSLINILSNVNVSNIWHLHMNDSTRITNTNGYFSVFAMYDNANISGSHLQLNDCIIQNGSLLQGFKMNGVGSVSDIMFDNVQIINSSFYTKSSDMTRYVYFKDITIENVEWSGHMEGSQGTGNEVYFPVVTNSDIKGTMVEDAFSGMVINNNTISHNSGFIVPPLNLNVECDTSSNVISLELPPEPYDALEYTFIDIKGNAAINNITVTVSTSPGSGVVNTLNGDISTIIDTNYGILRIRYSNIGGWTIIQETVVQLDPTKVDYDTIEYVDAKADVSTNDYIKNILLETWYIDTTFSNYVGLNTGTSASNGVLFAPRNQTTYFSIHTDPVSPPPTNNNTPILGNGTYYLYSNYDLVPYNLKIMESVAYSNPRTIYATSVLEKGRYLHKFTVTYGDFRFADMRLESAPPQATFLQFIKKGAYPTTGSEISIVSIDKIIGADKFSIDSFITNANDEVSYKELVTRQYVDVTKNNVDNVTIEAISNSMIYRSTENDYNLLVNDAWKHDIATTGFTFDTSTSPATLVNGRISLNLADDGSGYCETYNKDVLRGTDYNDNPTNWNGYLITNMDPSITQTCLCVYGHNGAYMGPEETTLLPDGSYLYRYLFPKGRGYQFAGFRILVQSNTLPIADSPWFELVKLNKYPVKDIIKIKEIDHIIDDDNKSIDSSNTPMSDAHKELITRAYSDLNQLTKKPIRLIDITNNVTLNGNRTIDGVTTTDGDRVGVFAQTTTSEDGFYTVNDSGNWVRTADMPVGYKSAGVTFEVLEGSSNTNTSWMISNNNVNDVVNVDDLNVVQTYSMANIQWQFTNGDRLTPINNSVEGIEIINNHNGYTWLTMQNTNTGNSAGSVIELHKSTIAYKDNVYFGIYSDNFYISELAGNGALLTDQNILIGTVDNTKQLTFIVGDSYGSIITEAIIDTNGMIINALKTTNSLPNNNAKVIVDTDTGRLHSIVEKVYSTTLTSTDIANKYIGVGEPIKKIKSFEVEGAPSQINGVDYEIDSGDNTRVTWNGLRLDGEIFDTIDVNITYYV